MADLPALAALVEAAWAPRVAVIGRRPGPMDDDPEARIDAGQRRVLDDQWTILAAVGAMPPRRARATPR